MSDVQAIAVRSPRTASPLRQLELVWWRFRRHRLALLRRAADLRVVVVLCPDFFATQDPERTDARQAFIPVQMLHLFDDGWNPSVPGSPASAIR